MENAKKTIIERIQTKDGSPQIYHCDIPAEYKEDKDIIDEERKNGMRKTDKIGFDVITQTFFVQESVLYYYSEYRQKEIWQKYRRTFEDFN